MFELEDNDFIWDKNKYEKVLQQRNIHFYEVVSALDSEEFLEIPHEFHEDRFLIVAKTQTGKILVVILSDEILPVYRIITTYEAEGRALDEYKKQF